ncbi:MAG: dTDP-4-dehydrorhamnose 3,5-epimerase [Anaerolineae bacterium]|nr:dTDP-4-dehydrorhamnose 3,5-epimerase [Anaerolineae bacterium]
MTTITESTTISGVYVVQLQSFGDDRGSFREFFRKEWFPQRSWDDLQTNCSHSKAGVLRGLHYHFHQVDYWFVPKGTIRAALFDMRPSSPTFMATQTVDMGEANERGLFIPIGVAHGFATLADATLVYVVDNYFDGRDEYGIAWNDPALGIDWELTEPVVSARDQNNPLFKDVLEENRPI